MSPGSITTYPPLNAVVFIIVPLTFRFDVRAVIGYKEGLFSSDTRGPKHSVEPIILYCPDPSETNRPTLGSLTPPSTYGVIENHPVVKVLVRAG